MASDIRHRVASRFLRAVDAKGLFRDFRQERRAIEQALKADETEKARRLFEALGARLEPLARMLEGVVIQRPDESRKFKNIKQWLHRIRYPFDPKHLDDPDAGLWIWQSLDTIEEALQSLSRVSDRLVGYGSVEKSFTHGPFTIDNRYGFRPDEYADAVKVLDAAVDKLRAAGFGDLAYGRVTLEAKSSLGYAGLYSSGDDSIHLNLKVRYRINAVYTLVHEFGHRFWHQRMTAGQRDAYEDAYSHGRALTLDQRQDIWDALVKADFKPREARRWLRDPSLGDALEAYFREYVKPTGWAAGLNVTMPPVLHPKKRLVMIGEPVAVVSDYAKTNVGEDFAETFAHHVMGMRIPDTVKDRFMPAIR